MAYDQKLMIESGIIFLVLPLVAVALRVWAKYLGQHRLTIDDYFVFAALIGAIGCSISLLVGATRGQLGQHQVDLPNGMPDLTNERFIIYEKTKFAILLLTPIGFGCVKASFLFFYLQIFTVVRIFRWIAYVMLGLVAIWTIGVFFACLFSCWPVTIYIEAFYGNKCINGVPLWLASAASDFTLDFIILAMPLPMVFRLKAPLRRKLAIATMFLLGGGVCGISVTRFVEFYKVTERIATAFSDETYITSPPFFWTVVEASTSVILACLPTYGPILKCFWRETPKSRSHKMLSYSGLSSKKSRTSSSNSTSNSNSNINPSVYVGQSTISNHISTDISALETEGKKGITVEQSFYQDSQKWEPRGMV